MKKIYTVAEVAEIIQVTEYTVRTKIKDGQIKGYKVGPFWRVDEEDLATYLEGLRGKQQTH